MDSHHSGLMILLACIAATIGSWHSNSAAADEIKSRTDPANQVEFFETQVRPILVKRCYECHSFEAGAKNGALVLETAEGIAAGGSRGGMFSPENSDAGLLFQALNYTDTDLQMPPDGKLPDDELALLKK